MRDERCKTRFGGKRRPLRLPSPILHLPLLLLATSATAAADKEEKWYQVEVIIFQQQDHYQQEHPRRDLILRYPNQYLELIDPNPPVAEDGEQPEEVASPSEAEPAIAEFETPEALEPEQEQPFEMLDASERQMNTYATTLKRRSGYRVLYHQAWRQPGINSGDAPWVLVRTGERYGEHFELEGSLRVVLDNYLHLETNMWMSSFQQNFGQEIEVWPALPAYPVIEAELEQLDPSISLSDPEQLTLESIDSNDLPTTSPEPGLSPIANTDENISLEGLDEFETAAPYLVTGVRAFNASRKLKLEETHYLDHPTMGILVRVVRYQPATPENEEPELN